VGDFPAILVKNAFLDFVIATVESPNLDSP